MTRDDHLDATAAALRGAAEGLRAVRDARGQLAAELARVTAERDELLDAARRVLDGHLHRAVIRQSDLANLTRLDDIVARLVPTRGKAAGCPMSPEDPQTAATHEEPTVSG